MTLLLRLPLLPGAVLTVTAALLLESSPLLAFLLTTTLGLLSAVLYIASADRSRRLLWAATAGAAFVLSARALGIGPPGVPLEADPLANLRQILSSPIQRLVPEPESAILNGILLGERRSIPPDLAAAFVRSGTTHLLAISGFNMTLVAAGVAMSTRRRTSPAVCALLTVLAVGLYSALVGPSPSVVRAALMSAVVSLGLAVGRPAIAANGLCAAAGAMIALDPSIISSAGFQLSVAATAGLIAFQARFSDWLKPLPTLVGEGLATTLAASLPTIPIVAATFGRISVISPIANLFAVPLFPALMTVGALVSIVGVVSLDAARPIAAVAYAVAHIFRRIVETSAALPFAAVDVPAGIASGAVIAFAFAVAPRITSLIWRGRLSLPQPALRQPSLIRAANVVRNIRLSRRVPLALVLAGLIAWPLAGGALASGPDLRIRALDVGQGDAYLIQSREATILIDGGPDPSRLLALLGATLLPWERRIDLMVVTHAHLDHGNGLLQLFDRYEIGLALEPIGMNDVAFTTVWGERAADAGVPRRAVGEGARLKVGDLTIEVLSPNGSPRVDVPSLVLRLERGNFSMLFTGDATDAAVDDLLLAPDRLPAVVYVPPHHGADVAQGRELAAAVRPRLAVLSVGAGNRYGHPTPDTIAALGTVPTYRTDRDGTVEISVNGSSVTIRTRATDLPPPRRGFVPYAPSSR